MNDNYLWNRSGPVDPEVERLERVLETLAHRGELPERARPAWVMAAIAASVLVFAAGLTLGPRLAPAETPWEVAAVDGARQSGKLHQGQTLRTDATKTMTLQSDSIGRVEIAPRSEVRVVARSTLKLARGKIRATIWAPPRQFVVDTPSARAIDLGCAYTLSVDRAGNGLVSVETGWVAFQHRDRESFIPAGADCPTSRTQGPGTPYFRDAGASLRSALRQFDETGEPAALDRVLSEARSTDGLTLWHLLTRAPAAQRGAVFDRFAALIRLPAGVEREGVVAGNARMLDLCWNALDLQDADWWREWKRDWQR